MLPAGRPVPHPHPELLALGPGHLGCFSDDVRNRTMRDFRNTGNLNMTIELCRDMAGVRGLRYYGLQWNRECYATNNSTSPFMHAQARRPCNMACAGNSSQRCGGNSATDVYDFTLSKLEACC
jgi:hypothetical protein